MKKHIKKILAALFLTGIILAVICCAINIFVIAETSGRIYSHENFAETNADCIIVLGAGLRADGSPSHMLRDRLDEAVRLYNKGVAPKILMSGDHGKKEYDEVNTMKRYAMSKGIPEQDIYLDHAGFSTYDSLYRAKEIFCVEKAVVVTQKYHLYRALYIADSLEISAVGVNSDPYRYVGQKMRDVREAAARVKDFFYCIFKPSPTYLGETINIQTSSASETYG